MKVRTSPDAEEDIREVFDYIARDSPQNAHVVAGRIIEAIDDLAVFEGRGRKGEVDGTLERVVPRTGCVVIYRVTEDEVLILRVWRSARGAARLS